MKKNVIAVIGLLFIAAGLYTIYAWGYKEIIFIQGLSIVGTMLGSILLLFTIFIGNKRQEEKAISGFSFKDRMRLLGYITGILLFVAMLIYVWLEGDKRVEDTLATANTEFTTATVTEVDSRPHQGRYDLHFPHIMVEYMAGSKQVTRRFTQNPERYFVGQQFKIKYSTLIPDMFVIAGNNFYQIK